MYLIYSEVGGHKDIKLTITASHYTLMIFDQTYNIQAAQIADKNAITGLSRLHFVRSEINERVARRRDGHYTQRI